MLMSVTCLVNAWSDAIPPIAGDAVMLCHMQAYIKHKCEQEAGKPERLIIPLVYLLVCPTQFSDLF